MPPSRDRDGKKRKYRSDGTAIWERRAIDGPGIWASCVRGKEKQAIGELCDLFESIAEELWPSESARNTTKELSLEDQIASEVNALKRPKAERLFKNCPTETDCVIFLSCQPPIDPVKLVVTCVEAVKNTGTCQTRYTHRLVPSTETCVANPAEIRAMCSRVFPRFFDRQGAKGKKFKVELRMRNHSTHQRQALIDEIVKCVPEGYTVSLDDPDIFILVEVFKSVCGISIVEDYYRLQKFNIAELAKTTTIAQESKGLDA